VSVSEEATDGWRRVRLPDGRTAWIEERALSFPTPGAAPAAAVPAPAFAPDLRPHIYVKDIDHLAELVRGDPTVSPMAERLAVRRRTALTVGGVGLAISTVFVVYGASQFGKHSDPGDPDFMKTSGGDKAFVGGVVGAIASTLVMLVIHPKGGDLLDVVNTWNVAHPDQPFTLERGMVGQQR
jgi:hypothetical protein